MMPNVSSTFLEFTKKDDFMCSNMLCSPTVFRKAAEPSMPHLTGTEISSSCEAGPGVIQPGNCMELLQH